MSLASSVHLQAFSGFSPAKLKSSGLGKPLQGASRPRAAGGCPVAVSAALPQLPFPFPHQQHHPRNKQHHQRRHHPFQVIFLHKNRQLCSVTLLFHQYCHVLRSVLHTSRGIITFTNREAI